MWLFPHLFLFILWPFVYTVVLPLLFTLFSSYSFVSWFTVPPVILDSSICTRTANQVNCSCETVGSSLMLQWVVDGQQVIQSNKISISTDTLNSTHLKSVIIVKDRNLSSLLCFSFNSVGSARKQFCTECSITEYITGNHSVSIMSVQCVCLNKCRYRVLLSIYHTVFCNTTVRKGSNFEIKCDITYNLFSINLLNLKTGGRFRL